MARVRTQKNVSRRIDLTYFQRAHPLRTGRKVFTFLVGFFAIAFITFFSVKGPGRLHNPGALTAAHASFQNNCNACHAGKDAAGGFSKEVADVSCLSCHDGAMHHPNQLDNTLVKWAVAVKPAGDGHGAPANAAAMTGESAHFTAANCVSCHTEHRGHELLVASNSQLCINCHEDLGRNAKSTPVVANVVTAFDVKNHPPFGRSITRDNKLYDATNLRFNHAKHNGVGPLKDNCVACHATSDAMVTLSDPAPGIAPPYRTDKDKPAAWTRGDDRRYIQPISYERNCIGCHAMTLPGKQSITIPHEDLATVRAFLTSVPQQYSNYLASLPAAEKTKLLTKVIPAKPPKRPTTKVVTEGEWLASELTDLSTALDRAAGTDPRWPAVKASIPTPSTQPSAYNPPAPNVNLLEFYVTNTAGTSCVYCHEVKGMVPSLLYANTVLMPTNFPPAANPAALGTGAGPASATSAPAASSASKPGSGGAVAATGPASGPPSSPSSGPSSAPASAPSSFAANTSPVTSAPATPITVSTPVLRELASIVPTGIPDGPRRWFANSSFDHNAHRAVNCLDCHAKALTSSLTTDVLSPNISDTTNGVSCVSCHKPDVASFDGTHRGAPANCTTCHEFHDPLASRKAFGTVDVLTGRPLPTTRFSQTK